MTKLAKHFVPNPGTLLILGLFLFVQSVTGFPSTPALTQGPSATLISYQGKLADTDGNPITTGSEGIGMTFALYDVSTGEGTGPGPNGSCWSETQTVSVSDGYFNVLLGSVEPIDPACLTGDVYLGITVGSDSEMTPREQLASVPYAVQAGSLPNVDVVDGKVGIGTTNPTAKLDVRGSIYGRSGESGPQGVFAFNAGGITSATVFNVLEDGESRLAVDADGRIGIGTTDPSSMLDVAGTMSVNDRINLIRNGYYATIESDSAGGGSGATRLYFYGYDANENRNRTAVFDGNGHAKFYGHLSVLDEIYTPRLNSPQNTDLVIDAGLGSHNKLTLHDDVDIHDGDLLIGNNHNVFISSGSQFQVDAEGARIRLGYNPDVREGFLGAQARNLKLASGWNEGVSLVGGQGGIKFDTQTSGTNRTTRMRLTQHGTLNMFGNDITGVDHIDVNSAHCDSCTTGAVIEANLQTEEEQETGQIDRFTEGDLQCWSPKAERLEKCTETNDRLVQSVADEDGKPIVMGAEMVKVIGPVKAGDLLVSSGASGYAMVNNDPIPGTVIAQALEDFDGEKGMIKAMIRKF